MTTPKPEISRKQAWCKLAMLIAEGLPDPKSIDFNGADHSILTIHVDSMAAFTAWTTALRAELHGANPTSTGDIQHVAIAHRTWHACTVWIYAYLPPDVVEPVRDDMDSVRAIADEES
jgi:hypothetical protein